MTGGPGGWGGPGDRVTGGPGGWGGGTGDRGDLGTG